MSKKYVTYTVKQILLCFWYNENMFYIILSLLLYSTAIMFSTLASRLIDSNLVSAIAATISAVIPIVVLVPILGKKMFENGTLGVVYAILCGILIGIFTLTINKSYSFN